MRRTARRRTAPATKARPSSSPPGRPPRRLDLDEPEADAEERPALALPALLDRDRRPLRLVAWRPSACEADRRRPPDRALVGDRAQERGGRTRRAEARPPQAAMSGKLLLRRLRGQRGYSLVEMLVVLVIMGTVTTALTTIFVNASNSELAMNNRFRAQQNARLALDKIRREVHCASSVVLGAAGSPSGPLAAASITLKLPSGCRAATGAPLCSGSATLKCVTWYASGA